MHKRQCGDCWMFASENCPWEQEDERGETCGNFAEESPEAARICELETALADEVRRRKVAEKDADRGWRIAGELVEELRSNWTHETDNEELHIYQLMEDYDAISKHHSTALEARK